MEPSPQRSDDGIVDLSDAENARFSPSTVFAAVESPCEDNVSTSSAGDVVSDKVVPDKKIDEENVFFRCQSCGRNPVQQGAVPKLLPCLHTFCDTCLTTLYIQQRAAAEASGKPVDQLRLRCPCCFQEFFSSSNSVESFSENQFIIEASEKVSQPDESAVARNCTSCDDESPAEVYCVQCSDWLCHVCQDAHQRVKITKDHTIQSKEEHGENQKNTMRQGKSRPCQLHPNETLKLFCSDCDALTCRDCQLEQHKNHKYQFMEEAANKHKDSLTRLLKLLQKNVGLLKETMEDVDKAAVGLKVREGLLEAEIRKEVAVLINSLKAREQVLIQDLKQMTKNKLTLLVKQRKDLKQMSSILGHNYNFATYAMTFGSNAALLHSRKILLTRLNNLNSLRYRQQPLAGNDIKLLLDQEKIKGYFGRIGFIYSQDDIKRKAEAAASRGLPLKAMGTNPNETGISRSTAGAHASSAHVHPGNSAAQRAPHLIALSSQGMPYAKVAPTTVPVQTNGKKPNALIVLQSSQEKQRPVLTPESTSMMTQLLKRKLTNYVGDPLKQTAVPSSTHQATHAYQNGEPKRDQYAASHVRSPTENFIDKINVTNVQSLNPAASRSSVNVPLPHSSPVTTAPVPGQPSQLVIVEAGKQSSPSVGTCSMVVPSCRTSNSSGSMQQSGKGVNHSAVQESTNDDYCAVCRNGGELLCCDTCPRVFHLTCHIPAVIQLPFDTWSCNLCRKLDLGEADQTQQKRRLSLQGLSEQDTRACEKVLLEVFCHPESTPFHHKVSKAVPNYHQIITHPMDLTTMRSKLQASHFQRYESIAEFCEDMNLIFSNCATFNPSTSEVARMGKSVLSYFHKLAKQYFPAYSIAHNEEPKTKRRRDEFILS